MNQPDKTLLNDAPTNDSKIPISLKDELVARKAERQTSISQKNSGSNQNNNEKQKSKGLQNDNNLKMNQKNYDRNEISDLDNSIEDIKIGFDSIPKTTNDDFKLLALQKKEKETLMKNSNSGLNPADSEKKSRKNQSIQPKDSSSNNSSNVLIPVLTSEGSNESQKPENKYTTQKGKLFLFSFLIIGIMTGLVLYTFMPPNRVSFIIQPFTKNYKISDFTLSNGIEVFIISKKDESLDFSFC